MSQPHNRPANTIPKHCALCRGMGKRIVKPGGACPACAGHGYVMVATPAEFCPHCNGRGVQKVICVSCRGTGWQGARRQPD